MNQHKITNGLIFLAAAVLSMFGIVITVLQLINSLRSGFDLIPFLTSILILIGFVNLILYSFRITRKSSVIFRTLIASYCVIVLVTGILFPAVASQGIANWLCLLSALIYGAMIHFDGSWSRVGIARIDLTIAFVAEVAIALISLMQISGGDPMMEEEIQSVGFVQAFSLFIRPILCMSIAIAYLSRMQEKANENK